MGLIEIGREPQLFVVDPIARLRPTKDSSVALMQAAQRAGQQVWVCTPAQLAVQGLDPAHQPLAVSYTHLTLPTNREV